MTKETRFLNLLDGYNSRKEDIDKRYRELIENAETVEATLVANMWHIQETNQINKMFYEDVEYLMERR